MIKLLLALTSALYFTITATAHTYSSGTLMIIESHDDSNNGQDLIIEMHSSSSDRLINTVNSKSKKADIKSLQELLIAHGYLKMPIGISPGTYGRLTREAVARYIKVAAQLKEKRAYDERMLIGNSLHDKLRMQSSSSPYRE